MRLLPVRPRPREGESLPGYAVRLARANGWTSSGAFLRALGLPNRAFEPARERECIETLHGYTAHRELLEVHRFLPFGSRAFTRDELRTFRNLYFAEPRVCPSCVADSGTHQASWQYLPLTHCLRHHQPLLNACPRCATAVKWDRVLIPGCQHCGFRWYEHRAASESVLPAYFDAFRRLRTHSLRCEFLRDLTAAAQRTIRPYDGILEPCEHPPSLGDAWTEVLGTAFSMLTDPKVIRNWQLSCREERSALAPLGQEALLRPVRALRRRLESDWPLVSLAESAPNDDDRAPPVQLPTYVVAAHPSRRRGVTSECLDDALRHQEELHGLAATLGCDPRSVGTLVELGQLEPTNAARVMRTARFDLQTLATRVRLGARESIEGARPLRSFEWLLPLFAASPAALLAAALGGELPVSLGRGDTLLDQLQAHPVRVRRVLERHLRKCAREPDAVLTVPETAALLRLPKPALAELARADLLVPLRWQRGADRFRLMDLVALLDGCYITRRWARLHGIREAAARAQIIEQGVTPMSGRYVYPKTPQVRRALRQLRLTGTDGVVLRPG